MSAKSSRMGPRMPGRPQWMWNMFTVAASMPSTRTSIQARLRSRLKRTWPWPRWLPAARCARVSDGALERKAAGVVPGVFSSSSGSLVR